MKQILDLHQIESPIKFDIFFNIFHSCWFKNCRRDSVFGGIMKKKLMLTKASQTLKNWNKETIFTHENQEFE